MAYYGAIAAAAAQKKRQERQFAEEENMTRYIQEDLKGDWEFKIVRSESGAFRKPEILEQMVDEEARAGWMMLEKFDNHRVRFKRPRTARARDGFLPDSVDPYRTRYDASSAQYVVLVGVLIGLVLLGLGMAAYLMVGGTDAPILASMTLTPLVLITLGLLLVVWKVRRVR